MNTINFEESIRSTVAAYWGIEKYKHIMEAFRSSKYISTDTDGNLSADFQKAFTGYYGLRQNEKWQEKYYSIFEEKKNEWQKRKKTDGTPGAGASVRIGVNTRADVCTDYRSLLERLHKEMPERIEASFASKMLHTLDDNMPILDSRVCDALEIKIPSKWTIDRAVEVYGEVRSENFCEQFQNRLDMLTVLR